MNFLISSAIFCICWSGFKGALVPAIPIDTNNVDTDHAEAYAALKQNLINDYGYTAEFAENVEINLKRAILEEKERQKHLSRQENQSEEDEDDEPTTPPGPTTPGPAPGDVVRGVAQILTSVGTLNPGGFWSSFVNFFPPNQRDQAQALVEASLGRRPTKWPTLPTTTTKLTTSTKDEDEIDSDETTAVPATAAPTAAPAATATTQASASLAAVASTASSNVVQATEAATRAPTSRYTIRPRTQSPPAASVAL